MTVALVASVGQCLDCDMRGVFVALRSLQREYPELPGPEVVVLGVTRYASDTLFFRQTMDVQRVVARIERMAPDTATTIFDGDKLPAMYLIRDGRVLHEWERIPGGGIQEIGRNELVGAMVNPDAL